MASLVDMSRNIEIKARIRDVEHLEFILKQVKSRSDIVVDRILLQEDVFFNVPNGRLKLRKIQNTTEAELIYYERADNKGPKLSDFCIAKSSDPSNLLQVLGKSLGIKGCIKKTRHLFIIGQTRVHIDSVEGHGNFIELEGSEAPTVIIESEDGHGNIDDTNVNIPSIDKDVVNFDSFFLESETDSSPKSASSFGADKMVVPSIQQVVLNNNQTESEGKRIADELMIFFSIKEDDLIECAYLDLPKCLV